MVARARNGNGGGGETELRGILKTFAILLIFFLKWVKLFYDFRRVPPPLPPPPSPRLSFAGWRRESAPPESNPRPPPSRSRHREKRNSLFVSFSPPLLVPLGHHHLCLLLLNRFSLPTHPNPPFLSRLLSMQVSESISRVFSRASPTSSSSSPSHPLPSPPTGGLFPRTVRKVSASSSSSSAPEPLLDLDTLPTPSADHFIFF